MGVRSDNAAFIETRLRELASKGLTSHEAAEATGWGYRQIRSYARRFGIMFAKTYRADGNPERAARADDFARRYQAGETLASIGESAGITRERVRQILTRTRGFDATDGGQFVKCSEKSRQREALRDRDSRARWGCSWEEHQALASIGREMMARGFGRNQTPIGAFSNQKGNARARGIQWRLTLWQWWSIWQQSGRWEDRGRGHGYVMCRKGDAGAYSPDNVVIAPGHANSSFQARNKSGLPIGVRQAGRGRFAACIHVDGKRVHLGIYPTSAQAHDAYLKAVAEAIGHAKPEAA